MDCVSKKHKQSAIVAFTLSVFFWIPSVALATPLLELPWPCGTQYFVTQGHNTGSHYSFGKWAWDFSLQENDVVSAPADGVIRMVRDDSTTHGCDVSYTWDANYIVVDFSDGTEALLLHLQKDSALVQAGQSVRAGDPLATVGLSGWVCGAHLHFQIQETCHTWWCQSIPATFVDIGSPIRGQRVTSRNCLHETVCKVTPDEVRIIDERESCYRRTSSNWWEMPGGHGGRFDYTMTRVDSDALATGSWHFEAERTGLHLLEVHIPEASEANGAHYMVHTSSGVRGPVLVNHSVEKGWISIGHHFLNANEEAFVLLTDVVPDGHEDQLLAFDALRIQFVTDDPEELETLQWQPPQEPTRPRITPMDESSAQDSNLFQCAQSTSVAVPSSIPLHFFAVCLLLFLPFLTQLRRGFSASSHKH